MQKNENWLIGSRVLKRQFCSPKKISAMTELASQHLAAVLLALVPFLITLSLFLYVFSHFTHNKLTRPFFLFLLPLSLWQLNEVFTRQSGTAAEVQYWCHLFNPFLNFIPPLGLHFAVVFARIHKWQKPLLLGLAFTYLRQFSFFSAIWVLSILQCFLHRFGIGL